ncbi:hypothetical protein KYK14_01165 [Hymenobacter profundi]|uniref:Uncharacterized protein n=1 Tax=Hymenobacter profundi TaxID=1982110 RepID=A0ABS6WU92_9BACT|nr:hypothetical protein [Hymenobacter profundi]
MGMHQAQGLLVAGKAFLLVNLPPHPHEEAPGHDHPQQQQPRQAPVGRTEQGPKNG